MPDEHGRPELGAPRVVIFLAMGAFLVAALATPGAFGDDGVLWGLAYLAARILHIALLGSRPAATWRCVARSPACCGRRSPALVAERRFREAVGV